MSLESELMTTLAPWRDAPRWCVALSGGLDSTVLLDLLAHLRQLYELPPLVAIHVDHGLQAVSSDWAEHCRGLCEALSIPLQVRRVEVTRQASLEQAARQARYAAFEAAIGAGDVLFTAQHRDDQAETLLFRLFRGAGVRGLAAMPAQRRLGAGWLVRPLLNVSRQALEQHARRHGLSWVDDPSNQQLQFARNHLRHRVLPAVEDHWPQARGNIARAAAHLAEARVLLDELADADLQRAAGLAAPAWLPLPSLDLLALRALTAARQRNALRRWLEAWTPLPDSDHWAGWAALRDAAVDAQPVWRLAGGELQRANDRVWWLSGPWLVPLDGAAALPFPGGSLQLPGNGTLSLEGAADAGFSIRYRQGGEALRLPGRGRRDLKRLLNEAKLPGFVRARLPLLYRGDELLAVANLPHLAPPGLVLRWLPPAPTSV